mgnify:CR=1 FL=1
MTKAALYYHYEDKEAMLRAVVEFRMGRMNDMMDAALSQVPEDQPLDRIRAFVRASARHIDDERPGWVVAARIFWSIETQQDRAAVGALLSPIHNRRRRRIKGVRTQVSPYR